MRPSHRRASFSGGSISSSSTGQFQLETYSKGSSSSASSRRQRRASMTNEENVMSHSETAELVQEMMTKQMEIAQKTLQMLETLGNVDQLAESQALTSQQEVIAQTFGNMVYSLMDRLELQEAQLEESERAKDRLQMHVDRTSEALGYKNTQLQKLEEKVNDQQEEIDTFQQEARKGKLLRSKNSRQISESSGSSSDVKELKTRLKKKSEELRRVKTKLNDSQFLLQAYKDKCDEMEEGSTSKVRKPVFNRKKKDGLQHSLSELPAHHQDYKKHPQRKLARDPSMDMSLYCM